MLAVGHLHNADVAGGPFGPARTGAEWQELFPDANVYDERELRAALLRGAGACNRRNGSRRRDDRGLGGGRRRGAATACAEAGLALPDANAELRANPLIGDSGAALAVGALRIGIRRNRDLDRRRTHPSDPERDRRLVDLPERW